MSSLGYYKYPYNLKYEVPSPTEHAQSLEEEYSELGKQTELGNIKNSKKSQNSNKVQNKNSSLKVSLSDKSEIKVSLSDKSESDLQFFSPITTHANSSQSLLVNEKRISSVLFQAPPLDDKDFDSGHVQEQQVPKRYCWGNLNRLQFACLSLFIIIAVFLAIFIPVAYFVIIPQRLQQAIAQSSHSSGQVTLNYLNFTNTGYSTTNFHANIDLARMMLLPGQTSFPRITRFSFTNPNNQNALVSYLEIPVLEFDIGRDSNLDFEGFISIVDMDTFQNALGGSIPLLNLETKLTIKFWGVTWYNNLALSAPYNFTQMATLSNKIGGPFPDFISSRDLNRDINLKYNYDSLLHPGPGLTDLRMSNTTLRTPDRTSVSITTFLEFENPTVLQFNATSATISMGNSTTVILDATLTPADRPVWQLSNQPRRLGFQDRVNSGLFTITVKLRDPSANFVGSFLSIVSQIQTDPVLYGPIDIVMETGGRFLGAGSSKIKYPLRPENMQKVFTVIVDELAKLAISSFTSSSSSSSSSDRSSFWK